MKIFDLLQTKYWEFDKQVKSYLSKTLSDYKTTYGNSTVFGQLINVLNSVVQNNLLYIEDALTEQNKYTAQRKKSIFGLAQVSGYNPSLGKAATCNIKLSFKPSNYTNLNVVLVNHSKIMCLQNGLTYNVVLPQESMIISLDKNSQFKYIQLVEGVFETQTFRAQGGQLYTQNIAFSGDMDIDFLEVKVNNEKWERVESLYDMDPNGKQFVCKTSIVKGIDLTFGNEQFGRSIKEGDIINVTYLIHSGELGNISSQESAEFTFLDNSTNIAGEEVSLNEIFNIVLADDNSINGGTYSETVDQVKEMIGFNSRSLVLADSKNYKNMINKFSFCGYNRTWTDPGSLIVNSLVIKNYAQNLKSGKDYFTLTEKDFFLSDEQKNSVKNCIANSGQQLAGTVYNIFDPTIWKYAAFIYIKCKNNNFDKISIESKVRDLIGEFMMNIKSDQFIPKSDIIHLLKSNIDDIDGVDVYFMSEKNETAIQTHQYIKQTYVYDISKGIYNIYEESVYVPDGEDPGLGLDEYGNIYLENDTQFPVLMGGWDFISTSTYTEKQTTTITDPLIIVFR